ncbi:hypothetical protein L1049_015421 [Liquidambar formosana]|uniref:Pentatricopeptide repeat-containing protein n=1 Tax=Liquidambar formosana TaxID=63359 RepID=A0AAP0RXT9_LIQFO
MILKKIKRSPLAFLWLNQLYTSCRHPRPGTDLINSSKLLSNYLKLGRIEDAQKLFDDIPEKNVVSWSIMIHGYAKNGFHVQSLELFSQMRFSGLVSNSFTIVGVLVGTVGLQDLVLGQSVHGLIVKSGLESDLIVSTAMLDTYAKCENIHDSYKLFEGLENPGLISCNAIIAGFIYNELFEEAVVLFNQFRRSSLVPNVATVLSLIRACVALELQKLSESIHSLIFKFDLCSDISVSNSVLDMYSSLMDLNGATKLFSGMQCKDVISWTTMIGLLVRLEYASDALKLFGKMTDSGVSHDLVVIMNLISACAISGDLKRGRQIHAQVVVCGYGLKLPLANSVIAMYSKCGDLDCSRIVFDQTAVRSLVSWTAMIAGYVQNGCPREALNLLTKFRTEENFCLDSIILVSVLSASGELALLELCQQLHCYALEAGFLQYTSVQNSLISTYSKCGNVELAHNVFKEMGNLREIVSWNAILNGFGINGHGETAVALFHEMRKGSTDLDAVTYLCILSACSHSGLVDDGLMIFNQMVEENVVKPSQEHLGCVVDLLARSGYLSDASGFVSKFSEAMDANAWRALLSGCMLHGNMRLAEVSARRVSELDPEEPGQVVVLSNVYASVGRFQDAEVLRLRMKNKELIKNPGISLLNGIPYDFG